MRRNSALGVLRSVCRCLVLSIGLLSLADESFAVDRRWNNGTGTFLFGTPGNWQGGVTPGVLDVAQFGISVPLFPAGTYTVNFNNNATNQALHIEDDLVTFNLNSRTYAVTAATGIVVGNQSNSFSARLTVTNGTITSTTGSNIDVGAVASRSGTLNVFSGGRITGSPNLNIGKVGPGTLNVDLGGDISTTGTTTIAAIRNVAATATIFGEGSTQVTGALNVGTPGNGTINVQLGGLLQNNGNARLGTGSPFTGVGIATVNVMNAGSVWNSVGTLEVGDGGSGEVNVTLAGKLNSATTTIGSAVNGFGEVNVDGLNSLWDNSGSIFIGTLGTGVLNVTNQGAVNSVEGFIGISSLGVGSGTANVSGTGSKWTMSEELVVGSSSGGQLHISGGGKVQDVIGYVGSGGNGAVTVDGAGSLWESTQELAIGIGKMGTLDVTGGGTTRSYSNGKVGFNQGSTGIVTISDAGSLWDHAGDLVIATLGSGTLNLRNGGAAQCVEVQIGAMQGGVGKISVDGAGSVWRYSGANVSGETSDDIFIGDAGEGLLEITAGGRAVSTATTRWVNHCIGCASTGKGRVHVDGAGSRWETDIAALGLLDVGGAGDGTLEVTAGGFVKTGSAEIASAATGTGHVIVDGVGSIWENTGTLYVGNLGKADVQITGGGVMQTGSATISGPQNTPSTVVVSGAGSHWDITTQLSLGYSSNNPEHRFGKLDITSGGKVTTGADAGLGSFPNTSGYVTVTGAGSTWHAKDRVFIGSVSSSGPLPGFGFLEILPGANVRLDDKVSVSSRGYIYLSGGTLGAKEIEFSDGGAADDNFDWTAGVLDVGLFHGDIVVPNGGTLAPGNSAGITTILGNYAQDTGGTLQFEIGGTAPVLEHDYVEVAGFAALSGILQLALIDGFVPAPTDTFQVLIASSGVVGAFANVASGQRLTTADGRGSFRVQYGAGSLHPFQVVLSDFIAATLYGDYNDNGSVDAADYTIWRNSVGSNSLLNRGVGISGPVGPADYAVWKSNFGASFGPGAGSLAAPPAVPEPSTLFLAGVSILTLRWQVRRRPASR